MYPGRVRRPRLPHRLRAARLPRRPARCAASRCPPGSRTAAGCPSRSSRRPPRPRSASTTRTSRSTPWSATVGADAAAELRDAHPRGLRAGPRRSPASAGIILADTKLEFGRRPDGTIVLADEVLTPDSSPLLAGRPVAAGPRPAVVRQADRARLAASPESGWDRASGEPPPPLPDEVVERTRARYVEAYETARPA